MGSHSIFTETPSARYHREDEPFLTAINGAAKDLFQRMRSLVITQGFSDASSSTGFS